MSILVTDLVTIAGAPDQLAELQQADRAAAKLLKACRGVLITDQTAHFDLFETVAASSAEAGSRIAEADADLKRFDDGAPVDGGATDAACARWSPVLQSAYYVGLAAGLRLAGGGR
ncbi:MAG: hypothetical protein ABI603_01760 [Acidobacteriota bacterium]